MKEEVIDFIGKTLVLLVVLALSWVTFVALIWLACWCFDTDLFTVKWATGLWICASLVKITLCPVKKDKQG